MEIEGAGMGVIYGEGVVTSVLGRIGGRHRNEVGSVGEYEV